MTEEGARKLTARAEPFNYILAHDLNNHLQLIQGHADHLLNKADDPINVNQLESIKRQTIAANALLQTVAGVTRGSAQAEYEVVDAGSLLSTEIDRLRSAYPDATISADIGNAVRVRADELLLSVWGNLLENALQHNDTPAPHVHVTASTRQGSAAISIEDDGPGLPDEARRQLLGQSLAHPQSGNHIIRTLVDRYGGNISAETSREGTKVTVELPSGDE